MVAHEADIYFSIDVEADGPIPGRYSMLAFGLAIAARFDGTTFETFDPTTRTFYRELRPISDEYIDDAVAVTGLDRSELLTGGARPEDAMPEAKAWILAQSGDDHPVLVGYPLVFDWLFFYWYMERFTDGSPVGFSSGLDMKSIYATKAGVPLARAGLKDLPPSLQSDREHTHNALDDAIQQAEIFLRLFSWHPPSATG